MVITPSFEVNVRNYNDNLLDEYAPVKLVPDSEYANLRKQQRKVEQQYKNTGLHADKQNYIRIRKQTTELAQ